MISDEELSAFAYYANGYADMKCANAGVCFVSINVEFVEPTGMVITEINITKYYPFVFIATNFNNLTELQMSFEHWFDDVITNIKNGNASKCENFHNIKECGVEVLWP